MRSMNKLPLETRVRILNLLVEGSSLRSITRVCGVSINTVTKLLVDAGTVCAAFHDEKVRDVKAKRIQCDEIWSFCYSKQKNVATAKAASRGVQFNMFCMGFLVLVSYASSALSLVRC